MILFFRTLKKGPNGEQGFPIFSANETFHVTDTSQRGSWIASVSEGTSIMIPHMASRYIHIVFFVFFIKLLKEQIEYKCLILLIFY